MNQRWGWVVIGATGWMVAAAATLSAAVADVTRSQVQAKIQQLIAHEQRLARELAAIKQDLEVVKVRATIKKKSS
ncbi:MAG: hypothetical protein HY597_02895 [Candidatus Omnitrophica bacterium]|nr:hypothetical protein [Candidatus Omnitrophota bacterium]